MPIIRILVVLVGMPVRCWIFAYLIEPQNAMPDVYFAEKRSGIAGCVFFLAIRHCRTVPDRCQIDARCAASMLDVYFALEADAGPYARCLIC